MPGVTTLESTNEHTSRSGQESSPHTSTEELHALSLQERPAFPDVQGQTLPAGKDNTASGTDNSTSTPPSEESPDPVIESDVLAAMEGLVNAYAILQEPLTEARLNMTEFLANLGTEGPRGYLKDIENWLGYQERQQAAKKLNDKALVDAYAARIDEIEDRLPPKYIILAQWRDAKEFEPLKKSILWD